MRLIFLLLVSISVFLSSYAPALSPSVTTSSLKSVTIYRTGAKLEHAANVILKNGDNDIVIEGLSSYPDINSIQVNCPAAVTILGMEFNNNYLGEENISPQVQRLKDSLESINDDIQKVNIQITTSKDLMEVLRSNKEIKGSQTGLSVAELTRLMEYYKSKSIEVQTDLARFQEQLKKLNLLSSKVQNQIQEEQKKNTRSGGRLSLQLSVAVAGNHEFNISYITQNAFWTPYYDIKSDNIKSPLKFIYKAKISQTTGIDWKKVKLSLSTASPKQYGNAPIFKTWFLGYIDPVRNLNTRLQKENSIQSSLEGRSPGLKTFTGAATPITIRGQNSISGGGTPLYIVNGVPMDPSEFTKLNSNDFKSVDVLRDEAATALYGSRASEGVIVITLKDGLEDYISVSEAELDITYDISLPYDVPTNGKPQIATLKETSVPAVYKYYSVPKLDTDAYLLAEVTNWQGLNLLPGEANIIFEGTYIGKSFIDPANTNDTLNLTLGIDKRVVVKKEKVTDYSSVKFLGSNKLQTMTYDLIVKNNKSESVEIILKDQYPISTNKEIEVELLENSKGIINEEIGVVTWIISIPPGKSEKRRISYSVKYPKGKMVNLN